MARRGGRCWSSMTVGQPRVSVTGSQLSEPDGHDRRRSDIDALRVPQPGARHPARQQATLSPRPALFALGSAGGLPVWVMSPRPRHTASVRRRSRPDRAGPALDGIRGGGTRRWRSTTLHLPPSTVRRRGPRPPPHRRAAPTPGRLGLPRWGTGREVRASVSTSRRSSGHSAAASRTSAALERDDAAERQVGAEVEAPARLVGAAGEAVEDRARRARPRRRGCRTCRPTPRGCGSPAARSCCVGQARSARRTPRAATSRGEWS